jgi:uncharacterized protein YneF (UPF0154 family)
LEWLKPLKENPQFTPEAVKEMQKSVRLLKGKDLSEAFFADLHEQ